MVGATGRRPARTAHGTLRENEASASYEERSEDTAEGPRHARADRTVERGRPRTLDGRPPLDRPPGVRHAAVADREFDLVVSLWTRPGHGPAPGVEHLVAELPDGPLDARQIGAVQALARTVVEALGRGRTVLVRCHSGHNRSGLVVAQALVVLGRSTSEAVAAVRDRRSPHALGTPVFEEYLRTGLDVARLLTGLDTPA